MENQNIKSALDYLESERSSYAHELTINHIQGYDEFDDDVWDLATQKTCEDFDNNFDRVNEWIIKENPFHQKIASYQFKKLVINKFKGN